MQGDGKLERYGCRAMGSPLRSGLGSFQLGLTGFFLNLSLFIT